VLLSVAVVNWNSRDDLERCLESLGRQTCHGVETIVVDNASRDGSADMVRAKFPKVVLLEQNDNLGFAEGCNRAIEASRGDWVALLNNDAIAEPDWAARLIAAAERAAPECGMLQSTMYFLGSEGTINSLGLRLTVSGGAIDRAEGERRRPSGEAEPIFCPSGGAGVYRRSMLDAIRLSTGYMDRDYFCYCEDSDLGWRAQLAGYSGQLVPDAVVHHQWHGSTAKRGRGWFVTMTRTNRLRTLVKNASPLFLVTTAPYSFWELCELGWHGGLKALAKLPKALGESRALRAEVARIAVRSRHDVEKRWVGVR
jgi:GT2 family glycosyltransferase